MTDLGRVNGKLQMHQEYALRLGYPVATAGAPEVPITADGSAWDKSDEERLERDLSEPMARDEWDYLNNL